MIKLYAAYATLCIVMSVLLWNGCTPDPNRPPKPKDPNRPVAQQPPSLPPDEYTVCTGIPIYDPGHNAIFILDDGRVADLVGLTLLRRTAEDCKKLSGKHVKLTGVLIEKRIGDQIELSVFPDRVEPLPASR